MKIITTIFFFLIVFMLAGQESGETAILNDHIMNFSDPEFNELEQKLKSEDPTFRFIFFAENDVSLFLAAQKKRPQSFIWIDLIAMSFAGEKYNARQLETESERKILFESCLQYLTESLKTLENTKLLDDNKKEYNYYQSMLKENIAFAAMGAGDYKKVKQLANELLINNVDTLSFNYGNTIHEANTLLGRVALREDDIKKAKVYLIKSGECPTSPQLSSFGPSCIFAKELLECGEKDIVLSYLDLIANVWSDSEKKLEKWREEIKAGKIPDDPKWK